MANRRRESNEPAASVDIEAGAVQAGCVNYSADRTEAAEELAKFFTAEEIRDLPQEKRGLLYKRKRVFSLRT